MRRYIFKILSERDWAQALAAGHYTGSADDRRDGFIHFSDIDQLSGTLEKHFAGQRDLVLVCVDAAALGGELRWEVSRGGKAFPHLYAELPVSVARGTVPLPDGATGNEAVGLAQGLIARPDAEDGDAA